MKGFKDSTKVQYSQGGSCYAKGGTVKGAAKISKVMSEFKHGSKDAPVKKAMGGPILPAQANARAGAALAARPAQPAQASGRPAMPTQAAPQATAALARKKGGPVKKAGGGSMDKSMVESTSSRPTKGGRPMTLDEMQLEATPAELAAVARGNRMSREEASESRLVRNSQKATPRTREVTSEQRTAAKRVGPAFSAEPMFSAGRKVLGALGLKKGGLAVMPRGKKGC